MKISTTALSAAAIFVSAVPTAEAINPHSSWADSYSANGKCYIDSTFDHGAGDLVVQTPIGPRTVRQVAGILGPGPGSHGNPRYNDVQCGHGPANDAGDEDPDVCPGRVDRGSAGCFTKGPRWDFSHLVISDTYVPPTTPDEVVTVEPTPVDSRCNRPFTTSGSNARQQFESTCGIAKPKDCDMVILDNVRTLMCANYQIGSGAPAGVPKRETLLGEPTTQPIPEETPTPVDPPRPLPPLTPPAEIVPPPRPEPELPSPGVTEVRPVKTVGNNARAQIRAVVGSAPIDCDMINGTLTCANYVLGSGAPHGVPRLSELNAAVTEEPTPEGSNTPPPVDPVDPNPSQPTPAGEIVVNAMNFVRQKDAGSKSWTTVTFKGETGLSLLPDTRRSHSDPIIAGINFWDYPDISTPYVEYVVEVPRAANYAVEVSIFSQNTEDNGAHVAVNGTWIVKRLQWCDGKGNWTYSGKVRTSANHCGVPNKNIVTLKQGRNTIWVGAREDGLTFNEFRLLPTNVAAPVEETGGYVSPLLPAKDYRHTLSQGYVDGDLLALHYDLQGDPDDLQAMLFTKHLLDRRPNIDYTVTIGTVAGVGHNREMVPGAADFTRQLFGEFFNARDNLDQAINGSATSWQLTLNSGGRVHVAEGGPSDFTALVIRELLRRNVDKSLLKNIRVIQHSGENGWNENNTDDDALMTVRRYATYIRIDNGNHDNYTSNFLVGGWNSTFHNSEGVEFRRRASNDKYASLWSTAFQRMKQRRGHERPDASDAVEVMWALGLPKSYAPDMNAFAEKYFDK